MFSGFLLKGDHYDKTQAIVRFDDSLVYEESVSGRKKNTIVIRQNKKRNKYFIYTYNIGAPGFQCLDESVMRSYYRRCIKAALKLNVKSIRIPELKIDYSDPFDKTGCLIAIDEINNFISVKDIDVYIETEDKHFTDKIHHYKNNIKRYISSLKTGVCQSNDLVSSKNSNPAHCIAAYKKPVSPRPSDSITGKKEKDDDYYLYEDTRFFVESDEEELMNRIKNLKEPFSKHLLFLMEKKGLTPQKVYERAYMDRRLFSKIKNNEDYHPKKITVLCLCVALHLSAYESKKLLATAGYTFSPSSMTDIIFGYFIEKAFYDIAEIDCQLNKFGLPGVFREDDIDFKILK